MFAKVTSNSKHSVSKTVGLCVENECHAWIFAAGFWTLEYGDSLANKSYSKHIAVQLLSSATSILFNEQRSYESCVLIKVFDLFWGRLENTFGTNLNVVAGIQKGSVGFI